MRPASSLPTPGDLDAALIRALPVGVAVWWLEDEGDDESLRLAAVNAMATRILGVDLEPLLGKTMAVVFPATTPERRRKYAEVARTGVGWRESDVVYGDLPVPQGSLTLTTVALPNRSVAVLFENLSAAERYARQVSDLNLFLDSIVETIPAMVFVKDAEELRFQRFNRAGEELLGLGREAMLGKNDYDFFSREQAEFFRAKDQEVLRSKALLDIPEEPIQTSRGQRWLHTRKIPILDADGTPRYLLGISEDITERKQAAEDLRRAHDELEQRVAERTAELSRANQQLLREAAERTLAEAALRTTEDQLRHSQRMEAVGRLAGGVAHDFNNLLSVILSMTELMEMDVPTDAPLREDLLEIRRAGERASDLTRQLLAFSRRQILQPKVLDFNAIVHDMERMLQRLIGEDVELVMNLQAGLSQVKADPSQMEQVVMNLVVNSRDAMPRGGRITVETRDVKLTESYAREHPEVSAGWHVLLAVSDTGIGMDGATRERIFEPFFTTKEHGRGTGLGLSTVYGIVKQSGGSIWVYSEPGAGTTFKIYLPAAVTVDRPQVAAPSGSVKGTETILLVEDDEGVRKVANRILVRQGYTVLLTAGAADALALLGAHAGPIHMMLTDVVMPHMNGRELADRATAIRPDLKVLFMSGYTDDAIVHHGVLDPDTAFIEKPLSTEPLARKVREVLDSGPRGA
jgi:two-component system cell cycle sensor histidine kinase/response regulator CckA